MAEADKPEQDMVCNAPMAYTRVRMLLLSSWVWRVLRVGKQAEPGCKCCNPRTQKSEAVKLQFGASLGCTIQGKQDSVSKQNKDLYV